jgi:hypothetical protein
LNDVIQDLLLSRWYRNRKVRLSLDLPDVRHDACTLVEQGHDLLIGVFKRPLFNVVCHRANVHKQKGQYGGHMQRRENTVLKAKEG